MFFDLIRNFCGCKINFVLNCRLKREEINIKSIGSRQGMLTKHKQNQYKNEVGQPERRRRPKAADFSIFSEKFHNSALVARIELKKKNYGTDLS